MTRTLARFVVLAITSAAARATRRDHHDFSHAEISPDELMRRHPELAKIQAKVGSTTVPLDLVIREYPELWQRMKDDPPVWRWFQTNMPHYTVDRVEGTKAVTRPFAAPEAILQFLVDVGDELTATYGSSASKLRRACLRKDWPRGEAAAELYAQWQVRKWQGKNWERARGGAGKGPARAWESHTVDRDYAKWFALLDVPTHARILDVGTEMGLQAIGLAKLGYEVVGTDVGEAELEIARGYLQREAADVQARVTFVRDDILSANGSALRNHSFDVVIDRAVYHSMNPYLNALPALRRPVDARFAARIKSLLRPESGVFVFKGMSDMEAGFQGQKGSVELNPLAAYRLVQLLLLHAGGVKEAFSQLYQLHPHLKGMRAEKMLRVLAEHAAQHYDAAFDPSSLWIQMEQHPMPHQCA